MFTSEIDVWPAGAVGALMLGAAIVAGLSWLVTWLERGPGEE